jgi:uncharacterized protein
VLKKNKLEVQIANLTPGLHAFDFEIDSGFFDAFGQSEFTEATGKVHIVLQKSETMITADISCEGSYQLICDRTLEPFRELFSLENKVYFKFGETDKELDVDLIQINFGSISIEFSQLVYDMICLSLPARKLHPSQRSNEENFEKGESYYFSTGEPEKTQEPDQRWSALKNLLSNENQN